MYYFVQLKKSGTLGGYRKFQWETVELPFIGFVPFENLEAAKKAMVNYDKPFRITGRLLKFGYQAQVYFVHD